MKKKKETKITEKQVAQFWETNDATEALNLNRQNQVSMIYEPAVQSISLRLPLPLLNQIKQIASHMDIAYQALIKIWLSQKAREESRQNV